MTNYTCYLQIEISFRIAWRRGSAFCNQSTIDSQALIGGGSLSCTSGCIGTLGDMSFYCTDFSETEDWTAGGRTYQTNISTPEFEATSVILLEFYTHFIADEDL